VTGKEKTDPVLEIRLELLHKEAVVDKDGRVVGEKHVQHTAFEITDQALCAEINELLGSAITKEHFEDVPKAKDGKPILDAHKFELTGKPPEKKKKTA
jgi:hypothetical protein